MKLEKLQEKEIKEYKREMPEALNEKWDSVKDSADIEQVFGTLKEVILTTPNPRLSRIIGAGKGA